MSYALPGITQEINDVSGQYVFYKDNSFERESYLGVIFYNESTYGFRFYSPEIKEKKNFQPETDISVFFSIDPEKNPSDSYHFFTGEQRIPNLPRSKEEMDIVNYIHEFAYEIFPKRINAGNLREKKDIKDSLFQFGGNVTISYDPLIPVFNLSAISDSNGKKILELVTAGQLKSSEDTSFSTFKGIPAVSSDKSKKIAIKKGKADTIKFKSNDSVVSIKIDDKWTQKAENLWFYGDSAYLVINSLKNLNDDSKKSLLRTFLLGVDNTYPDLSRIEITRKGSFNIISQIFYNQESSCFNKDIKIYDEKSESLIMLSAYLNTYKNNLKYFNEIINSINSEQ